MENKPVPVLPQALPCPLGLESRQEPVKARNAVPGHGDKSMRVFFRLCLVRAPSMASLCLLRAPCKAFPLFHHRLAAGCFGQVMGREVADTSLLTHCQGNFCSHWVTAFSVRLPDAGQQRAEDPVGRCQRGQLPPKKGQAMPSPGNHMGVWGLAYLSPLPFLGRQLAPSRTLCIGLLSPAGCSGDLHRPPGPSPG